jgi:hypothetical protein
MQRPSDWTTPASSQELRERMAALTGDTALLAFSAGKDAIAAWLAMRPHFKRIIPVHLRAAGLLDIGDKYLDGRQVACKLGIDPGERVEWPKTKGLSERLKKHVE